MRETVNKDDKISAYGVMKYLKKNFILHAILSFEDDYLKTFFLKIEFISNGKSYLI